MGIVAFQPPSYPQIEGSFVDILNRGKLLGTNIAPPETPEEIEAWIKERKARFPTAKKVAENAEKKRAETEAREGSWVIFHRQ